MAYLGLPDPYARGRNLLPLLLGEGPPVANTPAAVPAPSDSPTDRQRRQALERELRSLGYLDE